MLKKEEKFSNKVKAFYRNINQHHLKVNPKSNHNVIHILYPSFNLMEDCMKWMDSKSAQLTMDLVHKNKF